jgi:hypothetical protein
MGFDPEEDEPPPGKMFEKDAQLPGVLLVLLVLLKPKVF